MTRFTDIALNVVFAGFALAILAMVATAFVPQNETACRAHGHFETYNDAMHAHCDTFIDLWGASD